MASARTGSGPLASDAGQVELALGRSEPAGDAVLGELLQRRDRGVRELRVPDLQAACSVGAEGDDDALAVRAERGAVDQAGPGQDGQLIAGAGVEYRRAAVAAADHDLAAVRAERGRIGCRAGTDRE